MSFSNKSYILWDLLLLSTNLWSLQFNMWVKVTPCVNMRSKPSIKLQYQYLTYKLSLCRYISKSIMRQHSQMTSCYAMQIMLHAIKYSCTPNLSLLSLFHINTSICILSTAFPSVVLLAILWMHAETYNFHFQTFK